MKKLIDYFIERTSLVNAITVGIAVVGLLALWGMKRDLHPPFKFNYVQVSLSHPSGSAEEMERLVTYPLEEALRDIPELEEMTSKTRVGNSRIVLKFPQSVKNLSEKIEDIRGRVQSEMRLLPQGIRDIEVSQINDNEIFVASLGVTGIDSHNWEHHKFLDNFKNKLRSVSGINKVDSTLRPYHIFIRFDKSKLASKGVTVAQIRNAIRTELESNVIGFNSVNGKDWLLEFTQNPINPEVVKSIPLFGNSQGLGIKLGDVATIGFDLERNDKYHFLLNGQKAVEITVFKSSERDSMETFAEVKKELEKLEKPMGVSVQVLYDGPYFIQQQIDVLVSNGFGGLLLVLLMLSLTMGWKTSLMTAIGLPISYFGTFLILRLFGISMDLISMIAMILVVGNLVDDAVIFAERYNQLLIEGFSPKESASKAAKELIVPVSGTIATIICAFIPIIVIDSELSVIFMAIPIVVGVALLLSWFETFFVLPNHLSHFVRKPSAERATEFFHRMARVYKILLRHTLRFRYVYGLASLALLGFSLYTASKMPQDFSLSINAPQVEIFVTFRNENNFDKVQEVLKPLHESLLALPKEKLDFIETNLGWVWREGKAYRGPKYATVRLVLNKNESDIRSLRESVHKSVEDIVKNFKSSEVNEVKVVASERGSNNRRQNLATIQIRGRDEHAFRSARDEIIQTVENKGNVGQNVPPDDLGPTTFKFEPNLNSLRSFGMTKDDLGFQVQAQTGSVELMQTRDSGRWIRIYLEPEKLHEPTLEDLNRLMIQSPKHGDLFSVRNLGSWVPSGHSEGIEHKSGSRVLTMDFRFDGAKTNEQVVKAELESLIKPISSKHTGLEFKVIDANEQDKKGREWTGKIVLAAAILIYLILGITLRSWSQPFIVGLPIPFALIGVIWALKLHDFPLGLMAMIGLIGTMGVAVNDSIVMVHQINTLWKKFGERTADLIIEGAASRLRAITLTASCTLVGVFPTAYGIGGESGFTQPLAFSMGWGLSASLLLTLFIIPAMLLVLEDISKLTSRIKNKFKRKSSEQKSSLPEIIEHPAETGLSNRSKEVVSHL